MRETLGNLYWTTVYNGLTSTAWKNGVALRVDNSTNALKKNNMAYVISYLKSRP